MNDTKISRPSIICPNCGSADIDTEPSRGGSVCVNCGSVVEDTLIVSEIGFQEGSHGGVSVLGTFVNDDGLALSGSSKKLGGTFSSVPSSTSSAQVTVNNARNGLNRLASQLRLNAYCVDTAVNFYKLALAQNLTRGRKQPVLFGALMYLVCRLEGTSHLLLDFSDALQASIYDLGKTYLKLSSELCINAPITDPALYIPRFAQKLELGKKTHEVSMTALRLVSRMKKDWIHAGRRPSGLCGAALLVAARLHNFNRTTQQIVKIVRIRETTLKKRLKEFAATPSAALSLTEFFEIDLEEECDPPSYIKSKLTSKSINRPLENIKITEVAKEIRSIQQQIEDELDTIRGSRKRVREGSALSRRTDSAPGKRSKLHDRLVSGSRVRIANSPLDRALLSPTSTILTADETAAAFDMINREIIDDILSGEQMINAIPPLEKTGYVLPLPDQEIGGERMKRYIPGLKGLGIDFVRAEPNVTFDLSTLKSIPLTLPVANTSTADASSSYPTCGEDRLDLSGIDDDEIDSMLMNPAEVEAKTRLWESEFGAYVTEREAARSARDEATRLKVASARKGTGKKGAPKTNAGRLPPKTPLEAIQRVLREKRVSAKINYEVLRDLVQTSGPATVTYNNYNDRLSGRPTQVAAAYEKMAAAADLALNADTKPSLGVNHHRPMDNYEIRGATTDNPEPQVSTSSVYGGHDSSPKKPVTGTPSHDFSGDDAEGEEEYEEEPEDAGYYDEEGLDDDDDKLMSAAQLLASMRGGPDSNVAAVDEDY